MGVLHVARPQAAAASHVVGCKILSGPTAHFQLN
jgi:hypothetical protein